MCRGCAAPAAGIKEATEDRNPRTGCTRVRTAGADAEAGESGWMQPQRVTDPRFSHRAYATGAIGETGGGATAT